MDKDAELKGEELIEHRLQSFLKNPYSALDASPQGLVLLGMALLVKRQDPARNAPDIFLDVRKFHQKFKQLYKGPPRKLGKEELDHRRALQREEDAEWERACEAGDQEQQVDALIDKIYVAAGTLLQMGVDAREAWRRVQATNMAKEIVPGQKKIGKPPGWVAPDFSDLVAQKGKK